MENEHDNVSEHGEVATLEAWGKFCDAIDDALDVGPIKNNFLMLLSFIYRFL